MRVDRDALKLTWRDAGEGIMGGMGGDLRRSFILSCDPKAVR